MRLVKVILILTAMVVIIKSKAQENCTGYEELFRKRHQIAGGQYGHPYTIFDRKNALSFDETLNRVISHK